MIFPSNTTVTPASPGSASPQSVSPQSVSPQSVSPQSASPQSASSRPVRPEGDLGLQITINDGGVLKTLWLSRRNTLAGKIYETPQNVRLGIPVGKLVTQLLKNAQLEGENEQIFNSVESAKVDRLEFNTQEASFGLEIALQYGESSDSTLRLWAMLGTKDGKAYFGLKLRLGNPDDPVEVDVTVSSDGFSARLEQSSNPKSFNLAGLGRVLSPELEDLMGAVEIIPLMLALGTHKASGNYVLAFKLNGDVSLSRLPFVGDKLPKSANVSISDLGLVWCSAKLSGPDPAAEEAREAFKTAFKDIDLINPLGSSEQDVVDPLKSGGMFSAMLTLPTQQSPIPLRLPLQSQSSNTVVASQSTSKASKQIASAKPKSSRQSSKQPSSKQLSSKPVAPPTKSSPITSIAIDTGPSATGSAKWFDVNKTIGPLSLRRLGLKYAEQRVWFLFDTSISTGSVTLTVDGLGAGLDPFELIRGRFDPAFTLRGLGLEIKGPAEISGAFLRDRITDPRGDYDEFSGVVLIKTEALTISGMGSYADPPWSDPSLFAYAFLDKPIGGPPFFFVTGLALGLAVNRNLDLPPIDRVSQFPLVRLALGEDLFPPRTNQSKNRSKNRPKVRDTDDADLAQLLQVQQAMKPYTRPSSGQVALAIGVRFTTFKLVNSFALLVATFGKPFKLDLLISSRLEVPALPPEGPPPPSIAQVGIDLRGTWIPEDGLLMVEGRITEGSWFLDKACRLSGGAAFASWTKGEHHGDFVMTVGGYHPKFQVPAHYPQVPRLAFNFRREPIEIKGDAYFAMTPAALMTGGSLSATFAQGKFKAWFNCGADFLVAWEPFAYDAKMYIEVGASYRTFMGTVRASVGAKLHLWGPDLAGKATVDLRVVRFDINFGGEKTSPKPLSAQAFKDRFLPADKQDLISVGISDGLVRARTTEDKIPLFVVNPAAFALAIESVIPQPDGQKIGIGPMGKVALPAKEVLHWKVTTAVPKKGGTDEVTYEDVTANFKSGKDPGQSDLIISKPVPAALWGVAPEVGKVRSPGFEATGSTVNATVGYVLKLKNAPKTAKSEAYELSLFEASSKSWPGDLPMWESEVPKFKRDRQISHKTILDELWEAPTKNLVDYLTPGTADWFKQESIAPDWLDDLQEKPHVGTFS